MKSPVRHNIRVSFVNDEKVVSPPKNPTVKNKERYGDVPCIFSVNNVAIMPIKKQPIKFTAKVP